MSRDRSSSIDTVKAASHTGKEGRGTVSSKVITIWVHDDAFSKDDVLINPSIFDGLEPSSNHLVEIAGLKSASEIRDFQTNVDEADAEANKEDGQSLGRQTSRESQDAFETDNRTKCLLSLRPLPEEIKTKHPSMQISITGTIASAFGFRNRSQVVASLVSKEDHMASHVEIGFRDVYLARSDMWKLVESEFAGRTVYSGQRVLFLGIVKAVVKNIHVQGKRVNAAYFAPTTVPVFRSEAARYVLFIQMSREMWDFDSEGNGEILFNRVINGFLPDLFRRWSSLEVKHLVTIVMFGRLEYGPHDFATPGDPEKALRSAKADNVTCKAYEDFYRVVVTDMASAKWMTILDELKKDFRVFLRDISLEHQFNTVRSVSGPQNLQALSQVKIRGRLSTAMKGNILEAINIASSQFANDYIDRDLIRTGISVVVITAGSGVFDADRDLLNLTSENLTNNGIGIDIVCLSRMPLHSAPLFRYPVAQGNLQEVVEQLAPSSNTTADRQSQFGNAIRVRNHYSSFPSSAVSSMSPGLSRVASSIFTQDHMKWHYGIPHWIDLSYWTADSASTTSKLEYSLEPQDSTVIRRKHTKRFIPRVRMYEPQMMGIMELGLANISVPYIKSASSRTRRMRGALSGKRNHFQTEVSKSPTSSQGHAPAGLLTAHAKQQGDMIRRMDEYDADVFSLLRRMKSRDRPKLPTSSTAPLSPETKQESKRYGLELHKEQHPESSESDAASYKKVPKANKGLLSLLAVPQKAESPRISRSISYALRGLGAAPRATASTEINVENIQAQGLLAARLGTETKSAIKAGSIRSYQDTDTSDTQSLGDTESITNAEYEPFRSREPPSMPISINTTQRKSLRKVRRDSRSSEAMHLRRIESNASTMKTLELDAQGDSSPGRVDQDHDHDLEITSSDDSDEGFKPGSVVQDTIPFVRNVNASNPVKYDPNVATWFGRWQHLYPRKPRAATVKWRSLCTPASVPLTTEDFPGLDNLKTDFESKTYLVSQETDTELREIPRTRKNLFADMLALRLAHGYQWVIHSQGRGLQNVSGHDSTPMLLHQRLRQSDGNIYMTMGSTLQSLKHEGEDSVRVTRYRRKPKQDSEGAPKTIEYCPNIRTILSPVYKSRKLKLTGFSEEYPWEVADSYLANSKKSLDNAVERLRFWRARFVLLPVDPPATAWRMAQSTSENEEEIHLLGIRALTQMWQRQRYIPPQDKTFSKSAVSRRFPDPNPLSIIFETLNPSEIVATELDKLLSAEDTGELQSTQLLPDSELFERETFTLPQLAQAMQGDKGIEIKNRRWHLRLHYNCFQGEDFTNWLLRTFKDGEFHDRDDSVDFGNELMEGGLFTHVNGRHNFKDGNYFYSIAPEYRAHRAESRQSWMGFPASRRSERSIPATPASERARKDIKESSPTGRRSRSGSIMEKLETDDNLSKQIKEKNRASISLSLSKMIPIDVDSRKRSSKAEIVNLYYDRLHCPQNCYHFALAWPPTTTSALVENALSTWATLTQKYGLKLLELPIAEASKVSNHEPFRAPYKITLAIQPPKITNNGNFTSTSFTPLTSPAPDSHVYHKALLGLHGFCLDREAKKEFPSDVDVLLAWGKLEYTMTQYVHRSGVILAQITDDGSFLLLANRLYNTRPSITKDSSNKFMSSTDHLDRTASRTRATTVGQPAMQASGILGLNVPAPSSPVPSPIIQPRASADVFGNRAALMSSGFAAYITPEQIKDDLEAFASSAPKLEAFYREVANAQAQKGSSSSALRPEKGPDVAIPEIRLPPSLVTRTHVEGMGGRRIPSREQQSGSPLVKAETADQISEAVKSPMRGATL